MTILMEARDVRRHYPVRTGILGSKGVVKAVDGVSFALREGQTLGPLRTVTERPPGLIGLGQGVGLVVEGARQARHEANTAVIGGGQVGLVDQRRVGHQ